MFKKRNCKKGVVCGNTCISKAKDCTMNLSKSANKKLSTVKVTTGNAGPVTNYKFGTKVPDQSQAKLSDTVNVFEHDLKNIIEELPMARDYYNPRATGHIQELRQDIDKLVSKFEAGDIGEDRLIELAKSNADARLEQVEGDFSW